jgi:hypothetical protein
LGDPQRIDDIDRTVLRHIGKSRVEIRRIQSHVILGNQECIHDIYGAASIDITKSFRQRVSVPGLPEGA